MLAQTVALLAAIVHALSFILCKRGLRFSTPITITFVSLLVQTVVLFGVVLTFTGLPSTSTLLFSIYVVSGILQALVRQLTNIGIEKIGTARSGPIRASVPLWSAAIAIFFLGEKMTVAIAAGTLLVVGGILLISWRTGEAVEDFRPWYIAAPLLAALLGGVVYPLRRYALRFSHEQIYFGAVVGVVGFLCVCIYLTLPTTKRNSRLEPRLARLFHRRRRLGVARAAPGVLRFDVRSGDPGHAHDGNPAPVDLARQQILFARR